jgi:hypothetical protein
MRRPRLKTFLHQNSFLVEHVLTPNEKQVAHNVVSNLIMSEINSIDGLRISFDKPLGSKCYMCNFERPAVLRQYFGLKAGHEEVCAYGSGTGAKTVGTHPSFDCTREMSQDMVLLAKCIEKKLRYLRRHHNLMPNLTWPLNHCTVLFYFHKKGGASDKMLAFHTDNVYTRDGKFLHTQNSQRQDTPTCVVTIGCSRCLQFERQISSVNPKTGRKKWKRCFVKSITLDDNSLFVLDPSDECPERFLGHILFRWRHGVPSFRNKHGLSMALVFRSVTDVKGLDMMQANQPALHARGELAPDLHYPQRVMKSVTEVHKRLQKLFIRGML